MKKSEKQQRTFGSFFHLNTEIGWVIHLAIVIFFSTLAFASILVQIYSDVEENDQHTATIKEVRRRHETIKEIIKIDTLIAQEMAISYNTLEQPYKSYIDQASQVIQQLDQALMFSTIWPTATDLLVVPDQFKVNITTAEVLRLALKEQRGLRRIVNATTEASLIMFYSTIVDWLGLTGRDLGAYSPIFVGYQQLLAIPPSFQTVSPL